MRRRQKNATPSFAKIFFSLSLFFLPLMKDYFLSSFFRSKVLRQSVIHFTHTHTRMYHVCLIVFTGRLQKHKLSSRLVLIGQNVRLQKLAMQVHPTTYTGNTCRGTELFCSHSFSFLSPPIRREVKGLCFNIFVILSFLKH